jgi:excisionase family DNA binding protein
MSAPPTLFGVVYMQANGGSVPRTAEAPQYMTVSEAARAMRIGKRSVWRLIAAGDLPVVRFGRSVRVTPDAIRALAERGGTR